MEKKDVKYDKRTFENDNLRIIEYRRSSNDYNDDTLRMTMTMTIVTHENDDESILIVKER